MNVVTGMGLLPQLARFMPQTGSSIQVASVNRLVELRLGTVGCGSELACSKPLRPRVTAVVRVVVVVIVKFDG
jgi:hypothetical protein